MKILVTGASGFLGRYVVAEALRRDHGFETRPGSTAWGAPRSFVRDPAGNHIEVMAEPPPTR